MSKKAAGSKKSLKFTVDLADAVEREVIVPAEFADYLKQRVKVDGKAGNLAAGGVAVAEGEKNVVVTSTSDLSKRYIKYLTKRYISSIHMRDVLHVVSASKDGYAVKIFRTAGEA